MKWMEIIKLRSAEQASEPLTAVLTAIVKDAPCGLIAARIYRHALWETDWSLHIHWDSAKPDKNGSLLGLRLSHAFEEFGLVDHSIWIEESE